MTPRGRECIFVGVKPEGGRGGSVAHRPHPRPEAVREDRPDRRLPAARGVEGDLHFPQARRHGAVEQLPPIPHLARRRQGKLLVLLRYVFFLALLLASAG